MRPDDPRHGTYAGAVQHWTDREPTCLPCREAATLHRKRRKYAEHIGLPVQVDAGPTIRRLRALQAIGHSMPSVARVADLPVGTLHRLTATRNPFVRRTTADAVTTAYVALCMTVPVGRYVTRDRARAAGKGWLPPLAWADIAAGRLADQGVDRLNHSAVDPILVDRMLAGDMTLARSATKAERVEVVARWHADGRTLNELERLTGWEPRRYLDRDAA
jgi:hypothetical protein